MTRTRVTLLCVGLATACGGGTTGAGRAGGGDASTGAEAGEAPRFRVTVVARTDARDAARRAVRGLDARVIVAPGRADPPGRLVEAIVERARALYRELAFEESLVVLEDADRALAASPDDVDTRTSRHAVLVLRGMDQLALGRPAEARATLVEAARLRPRAELDEARHPPDVRALYLEARRDAGAAPLPAPSLPGGAPGGEALARALADASYEAIAEVPPEARASMAEELDTDMLVVMRGGTDTVALDLRTGQTRTALPGVPTSALLAEVAPAATGAGSGGSPPRPGVERQDDGGILTSPWFWIATGVVVAGGATAGILLVSDGAGGPVGVAGSGF